MRISYCGLLVLGTMALTLAGCQTAPPPKPAAQNQRARGASTQAVVDDLNQKLNGLSDGVEALPGNDQASDLVQMRGVLQQLRGIVTTIEGTPPTPDFNRATVNLDAALLRLSSLPPDVSPAPHVDNALRSLAADIHEICDRRFPGNTEIAARLSKVDTEVGRLDSYYAGPLQREQAALAARAIVDALRAMVRAIPV